MANALATILAEIIQAAPELHTAGTFSRRVLEGIFKHASLEPIAYSVETGSGASTLLFSHLSEHHTVFALDYGTGSIDAVRSSPLFRSTTVTFVEGPTQLTLPRHHFDHRVQLALIDGPHAYPFPDLEYYYFYPQLDPGALLIVDDIHIATINHLFDFLCADDMFQLQEVIETTAFFRRTDAPTFSPTGDGWWTQGYNRRDFETQSAKAGESDALERVQTATPWYLDELGPVQNPLRRPSVTVPPMEPLLVAGWAIDQQNARPAAWVEVVVDGQPFRIDVRVPRGDVAAAHGDVRYLRCGFRATLPGTCVPAGRHTLTVRVVVSGGRRYYQSPLLNVIAE
jgi:hypothetical protein